MTNKETWEERFDEMFEIGTLISPTRKLLKIFIRTEIQKQEEEFKFRQEQLTIERHKLCQEEIQQTLKELRGEIEGMELANPSKESWGEKYTTEKAKVDNYNQALTETLSLIDKKLKEYE